MVGSPRPILRAGFQRRFAPIGADEIPLDEIDHFTGESESQRRFAPTVIAEDEIVDRFQLKSVIVPVKIRTPSSGASWTSGLLVRPGCCRHSECVHTRRDRQGGLPQSLHPRVEAWQHCPAWKSVTQKGDFGIAKSKRRRRKPESDYWSLGRSRLWQLIAGRTSR
jgi:hypothetical protein